MVILRPDPDDLRRLADTLAFVQATLPILAQTGASPALLVRLDLLYAEGQTLLQSPHIADLLAFTTYAERLESAILAVNAFLIQFDSTEE